jgi:hypothetical protein
MMALCRVCNSHHFVNRACVSAAVTYGQLSIDASRQVPTFFGFSASLTTLASTKTAELGKIREFYDKVFQMLKSKTVCWRDMWLRFRPIWKLLGKRIYVLEITLNQVEDLYDRSDYWLLQTMCNNRTARFHDGTTKDGVPLSQWSVDGMIENLQKRYKCMQFKNNEDDWCKHSISMAFVSMCIMFVNTEYGKRYDVESMDEWNRGEKDLLATDNANKKLHTIVPKHIQEMKMVQEILKLSELFVETPGCKFKGGKVWATLPNLMSKVASGKGQYVANTEVDEDTQLLL